MQESKALYEGVTHSNEKDNSSGLGSKLRKLTLRGKKDKKDKKDVDRRATVGDFGTQNNKDADKTRASSPDGHAFAQSNPNLLQHPSQTTSAPQPQTTGSIVHEHAVTPGSPSGVVQPTHVQVEAPTSPNKTPDKLVEPEVSKADKRKSVALKGPKVMESIKMSDELIAQLALWEKNRRNYLDKVEPLLAEKMKQFEDLFSDYIGKLSTIITEQGFEPKIKTEIVEEESKRFESMKKDIFGSKNAGKAVLEKEIEARKNVLNLEKRIVVIQAVWRGYRDRKKYGRDIKRDKHRTRLAKEILETEKVYVSNLSLMVTAFVKPLREISLKPQSPISNSDVLAIFSNVELILGVNKELLSDLEKRITSWSRTQCIGDVFLRLAPFLKLYIQYVNNYNVSIGVLSNKLQDPQFAQLMKRITEENPEVVKMGLKGLQNFQILPVQRIPRYEMLLKDMVKNTDEDHPDFKHLCEALFKIQDVAKKINESKRIAENVTKILEIQAKMGRDDFVQPHRKFILEGPALFEKESHSKLGTITEKTIGATVKPMFKIAPCYLYLFNDLLVVAEKKKIVLVEGEEYKFRLSVPLDDATLEPLTETDPTTKGFQLLWQNSRHCLKILYEKGDWMKAVSGALKELQENKSSLKLDEPVYKRLDSLVSQLPSVPQSSAPTLTASLSSSSLPVDFARQLPSKLSELMPIYEQVFELETSLFKIPIELDTLLPQYCQSLHPSFMLLLHDKLQELKKRIDHMKGHHDHIEKLLKKEKIIAKLSEMLKAGHEHIGKLTQSVGRSFPKTSTDPNAATFRMLTAFLMEWYINLMNIWDIMLDEECCAD